MHVPDWDQTIPCSALLFQLSYYKHVLFMVLLVLHFEFLLVILLILFKCGAKGLSRVYECKKAVIYVPYWENCWVCVLGNISFLQWWVVGLLVISAKLMNQQMFLNRNTNKIHLCLDWLMECHQSFTGTHPVCSLDEEPNHHE